jgi:endonuclease/exonuclease/phosphatase family metal-dependent hydrolase
LMGDFNSGPKDAAVQLVRNSTSPMLVNSFTLLNHEPGQTFHNFQGGELGDPIDYIFVSENVGLRNIAVIRDNQNGKYPSDHYPVIASIFMK